MLMKCLFKEHPSMRMNWWMTSSDRRKHSFHIQCPVECLKRQPSSVHAQEIEAASTSFASTPGTTAVSTAA